jgi:hypothetical protein
VRVELRDLLHIEARTRSNRALWSSAVLGVIVVTAAGISGTIRFAGPRWVPDWNFGAKEASRTPRALPPASSRLTIRSSHGADSFPLGRLLVWIIIGVAVISVVALLWRWWTHRPLREASSVHSLGVAGTTELAIEPEIELEADTPTLRSGIELALQLLDEQRDPADAVVRAWLGLQETAEESGIVRRPAETPTEFTSRILNRAFVDDRAVRTLLNLYLRTRFGDHPVTSADVAAVGPAQQELGSKWPESVTHAGAGSR